MANRRMEFMIGMTVLVVFATIVIMAVLFGSNRTSIFQFKQGQKMSILFDRAPGIKNTSRVTKSGVEIGRVVRTQLVDDGPTSHVLVNFTIDDPNVHIYSNEQARIKPSLLMGEAEIEFVKNPDYTGTVHEIGPDEPITGNLGGDILGTVSNIEDNMKSAITSIETTAQQASGLIARLNMLIGTDDREFQMGKERFNTILNSLSETLQTTRSLTTHVNDILSDPQIRENIEQGAKEFPEIIDKVNRVLDNGENLFNRLNGAVDNTEGMFSKIDETVNNVHSFSKMLNSEGKNFFDKVNNDGDGIAAIVSNISKLSNEIVSQLDNKDTPLGMLTDEEVGREVRGIVRNVEAASEKIQPILDDARVFTNKIAHRPSALVFSRDTYKGTPSLGNYGYSYQPYSPAGGMSSHLWTETCPRTPCPASAGSSYYPDSLEAFRAAYPETYSELQRQKPIGSCLSANPIFGKVCGNRGGNDASSAQSGYVSDPGAYYGLEGVIPTEEYYAADGSYPETMPVSSENAMNVPQGGVRGMKFSLTRAIHKVFGGNGDKPTPACPLKPQVPPGVPMIGALYGTDGWTSAEGIPAETISWAPSFAGEDVSLYEGGCAPPECEVPSCATPGCDLSAGESGGAPMTFGDTQETAAPSPNRSDYGPMESPLPPKPSETSAPAVPSDETNPASEELPSSVLRPESSKKDSYQTSGVAPGYSNSAAPIGLPAPVKARNRSFVDDGLPLRFSPNN